MNAVELFAQDYQLPDATPEQLAYGIARLVYPTLRQDAVTTWLDRLAADTALRLHARSHGQGMAIRFLDVVTQELGFHGDLSNYYDPRNSLLPDVLERKTGLPIMLAIVCMSIGRRLNLEIEGLAFPSHFLTLYRDAAGTWVLDPFYGEVIDPAGVERYLTRRLERPVQLSAHAWHPASAQTIALRILHNLRNSYLMRQELDMAGKILDYLVAVEPGDPLHWRERGLLHFRAERWEECQHDLRLYLTHCGHLDAIRVKPAAEAISGHAEPLSTENQQIVTIYREAGEKLARCN